MTAHKDLKGLLTQRNLILIHLCPYITTYVREVNKLAALNSRILARSENFEIIHAIANNSRVCLLTHTVI